MTCIRDLTAGLTRKQGAMMLKVTPYKFFQENYRLQTYALKRHNIYL